MRSYTINECFFSPQGEGHRAGTMNVFLRFTGCNLQCVDAKKLGRPMKGLEVDAGFHCDTDFHHGKKMSLEEVLALVRDTDESLKLGGGRCGWIICTGGEPTLQLDAVLVEVLHTAGYRIAIETNGTHLPPPGIDWISCSPKRTTGERVKLECADEVRVVLRAGETPDTQGVKAEHYFVSPAFLAPTADIIKDSGFHGGPEDIDPEALATCLAWIKKNPTWRLSMQQHKFWRVR